MAARAGLTVLRPPDNQWAPPHRMPVPLRDVAVEARIVDVIAKVTVRQTYFNVESDPLEAIYVFPLDDKAAVCDFSIRIDGRTIVGEVQEKEKAREAYKDATSQGHGAYLMEQHKPDVFQINVGNLPPRKAAVVTISYVTELSGEGHENKFFIPTAVAPRYCPVGDQTVPQVDYDAEAGAQTYGLHISTVFKMHSDVQSITSTSHEIVTSVDGKKATMKLETATAVLDRDLVLFVATKDRPVARAIVEDGTAQQGGAAMVTFIPHLDRASQCTKCEFVFLLDRSGSMRGGSIAQARAALQLFLRSLPLDCYFNIHGFGSHHVSLFPESRKYDEASLGEASGHADSVEADLGGTEILTPLQNIFAKNPIVPGYQRKVFVLTDGQVGNTDQVLSLVKSSRIQSRTFSIGIGPGVSHHLVEGIARMGGGTAEFVTSEDRLGELVVRQLENAMVPAIEELSVIWSSSGVAPVRHSQAPVRLPPAFAGRRLTAYALFDPSVALPTKATIRGTGPNGPFSTEVAVNDEGRYPGDVLHKMAVKVMIRDLEEDRKSAEACKLSLEHGILCAATSLVAVEERSDDTKTQGPMRTSRVPVAPPPRVITSGWRAFGRPGSKCAAAPMMLKAGGRGGGVRSGKKAARMSLEAERCERASLRSLAPYSAAARAVPLPSADSGICKPERGPAVAAEPGAGPTLELMSANLQSSKSLEAAADERRMPMRCAHAWHAEAESKSTSSPVEDVLMRVVRLQSFSGAFQLDGRLAEALGADLSSLRLDTAAAHGVSREDAWATALVLEFLNLRLKDRESEWGLLAQKSQAWLSGVLPEETVRTVRGHARARLTEVLRL